jgi:hypothetical protein
MTTKDYREATEQEYEDRYGGEDETFPEGGTPEEIARWARGDLD